MHGIALAFLAALAALQDSPATPTVRASRATVAPTIDGRLSESVWQAAPVWQDFRQWEPAWGQPPTERTEVRVLYDDGSLFVGVRLFDSAADQIVRRLSRRDDGPDADRFTLYLDGLHDRTTGAAFEVSAAGSQRDQIISNDVNTDNTWDAVWEVEVTIDSEGWTAELRIPLSQLRFRDAPEQTWGINLERFIYRKNERVWLALVPRSERGLASRMADLTGIDGVRPRRALEILPYTSSRSELLAAPGAGNPFHDGSRLAGATGFDLKYAVKPSVVLNATVNPDFGQVEIDPAVVNLTAFEVFFPERRPFFTEGAQIFTNFGGLGANNRWGFNRSEPDLLYTRRIGRRPQGRLDAGGAAVDFADVPIGTTILGAAKLTGTSGAWTFGVLDAVTSTERARVSSLGAQLRIPVEPSTNYLAARVFRELRGGRAGLGGLVTTVDRSLRDAALSDLLPRRGRVGGIDGYVFLDRGRQWVINGRLVGSRSMGSTAAIARLQRAPQRFLQRPDTPHLSFDPTRTSLAGWSGALNLNRNQGAWTVNAAVWSASPGVDSSDIGFHYNGDVWGEHVVFQWQQVVPDRLSRDRSVAIASFSTFNHGGTRLRTGTFVFGGITFRNYWNLGGNVGLFGGGQDDRLTRGGPPSRELPSGFSNVDITTDTRKRVVLRLNGGVDWSESGSGGGNYGMSVEWKPTPRFNMTTGPSYSSPVNVAQYLDTVEDASALGTYGSRYVFGRLEQKNLNLDTRLNVLFAPKATLQVFMQPLIAVGDYVDVTALTRSKAFAFEPYVGLPYDPDFSFKSLRMNAVFRWEWRLGSNLFIAWTQQRQDFSDPGQLQVGRDLGRVFTGPADNVLFVKLTRWFGR